MFFKKDKNEEFEKYWKETKYDTEIRQMKIPPIPKKIEKKQLKKLMKKYPDEVKKILEIQERK